MNIKFNTDIYEQTTAFTDIILFLIALHIAIYIKNFDKINEKE